MFPLWCVQGGRFSYGCWCSCFKVCRFFVPCSSCGVSRGGEFHRVAVHVFRYVHVVSSVFLLCCWCVQGEANFIGLPFMCSGLSFVVFVFPLWCVQGGEFHMVAVHVGAEVCVCRFFRVRLVVCPGGVNFIGLPFMCSGLSFLSCSPSGVPDASRGEVIDTRTRSTHQDEAKNRRASSVKRKKSGTL